MSVEPPKPAAPSWPERGRGAWNLAGGLLAAIGFASLLRAPSFDRPPASPAHLVLRWAGPVAGSLLLALGTLRLCPMRRAVRGTALESAWAWTCAAWLAWLGTQALVFQLLWEPSDASAHLSTLAAWRSLALALSGGATVAVLGARRPGTGAWNWIVLTLVAVLLLPIVQQWAANHSERPAAFRLDGPPLLFAILLGAGGVVNYLPTRWGARALLLGVGCAVQLWPTVGGRVEQLVPASTAAALLVGLAFWLVPRRPRLGPSSDALWLWFRDRWGLVWARRVQDRFNRSAREYAWPVVLTWQGRRSVADAGALSPEHRSASEQTLRGLLRRFADREILAEMSGPWRVEDR